MTRYHINNKGEAGKCSAIIGNCLFKNDDLTEQVHYSSIEEARRAAEQKLKEESQIVPLRRIKSSDPQLKAFKGSDVSIVSNLCEDAMATNADVNSIARTISQIDDSQRVIALRKLDKDQISKVLKDWQAELNIFVERRAGTSDFEIHSGNIGGNSADSDFVVISQGAPIMNLEAKFGSATNGAIGIERASNLTGFPSFNLSKDEKAEMMKIYAEQGENAVVKELLNKMNNYVSEFNKEPRKVNSHEIYDIVKSSGKKGNSDSVKDYSIVNFRQKEGVGQISETELTLTKNENWNVRVAVNSKDGTARLAYLFETNDKQKQLKVLFNNKNSLYAAKSDDGSLKAVNKKNYENKDELVKIQSKFQMGVGSYNVWYKEGLEPEEL